MKLKSDTKLAEFMTAVQVCDGEVFFVTGAGDRLNLKSALSQFLFSVIRENRAIMADAEIECMLQSDKERLSAFLTD